MIKCSGVHYSRLQFVKECQAKVVLSGVSQLSTFGRCEYEKTCQLLISLFDQAAQSYQELVQNTSASARDIAIQEGN